MNKTKHAATIGEKAAAKARKSCNKLNDSQREALLDSAMQIIYGGGYGKVKTVRH